MNTLFILTVDLGSLNTSAIGVISAKAIFGNNIAQLFNIGFCIILLSSISILIMLGPRVYYSMAKDRVIFKSFRKVDKKLITPINAIILQMGLAIIYMLIGKDIETLLIYMGFALDIFPLLTVIGLIVLRIKKPHITRPYTVPFYPITPFIFIILSVFMLISSLVIWTKTSLFAIIIVLIGIPIYYLWKFYDKYKFKKNSH